MITLFENITEELTDVERDVLAPLVMDTLKYKNIDDPVKGKHIVAWLKSCGYKTDEIRLRKIISYMRQMCLTKDYVICAGSKGYYCSSNLYEIDKQIESIEGRRNQLNNVLSGMMAMRENIRVKKCGLSL